jgi:hypothetical protein
VSCPRVPRVNPRTYGVAPGEKPKPPHASKTSKHQSPVSPDEVVNLKKEFEKRANIFKREDI